jgi:hypothetical protein
MEHSIQENSEDYLDKLLEEDDTDIDTSWIKKTQKCISDYDSFYRKDVSQINVSYVYINKINEIIRISKKINVPLSNINMICSKQLRDLTYSGTNNISSLQCSLWKSYICAVDIDESDVSSFVYDVSYNSVPFSFIRDITKNSGDIYLPKIISHFQDINTLYLMYKETDMSSIISRKTRKNRSKNTSNNQTTRRLH